MCSTNIKTKAVGKERIMAELDLDLLVRIMSVQSYSQDETRMKEFIRNELKKLKLKWTEDTFGNIYVTKGRAENYPTIVAHMDTVHSIVPELKVYNSGSILFAMNGGEQTGIGGDDKVGIYTCFHILKKYAAVKAVFFSREEIGCVGSNGCNLSYFDDSAYVMQCDRKGNTDFVRKASGTELHGDDFLNKLGDLLPTRGYESYSWGGITDVATLKDRGLKVSAFNMSCGYWRPHTSTEVISLPDIAACTSILEGIVDTLGTEKQLHEKPKYTSRYSHDSEWDEYYTERYYSSSYKAPTNLGLDLSANYCTECGDKLYKDNWCSICRRYEKNIDFAAVPLLPEFASAVEYKVKKSTIDAFDLNDEWTKALSIAIADRMGTVKKTLCCETQLSRDTYGHLYCADCLEYLVYTDNLGQPTLEWEYAYWGN